MEMAFHHNLRGRACHRNGGKRDLPTAEARARQWDSRGLAAELAAGRSSARLLSLAGEPEARKPPQDGRCASLRTHQQRVERLYVETAVEAPGRGKGKATVAKPERSRRPGALVIAVGREKVEGPNALLEAPAQGVHDLQVPGAVGREIQIDGADEGEVAVIAEEADLQRQGPVLQEEARDAGAGRRLAQAGDQRLESLGRAEGPADSALNLHPLELQGQGFSTQGLSLRPCSMQQKTDLSLLLQATTPAAVSLYAALVAACEKGVKVCESAQIDKGGSTAGDR